MLLEAKVVYVPAPPELDADRAEFGHVGNKCRAAYGEAAIAAGQGSSDDDLSNAVDALTNLLHAVYMRAWCEKALLSERKPEAAMAAVEVVLESARMHFETELDGER